MIQRFSPDIASLTDAILVHHEFLPPQRDVERLSDEPKERLRGRLHRHRLQRKYCVFSCLYARNIKARVSVTHNLFACSTPTSVLQNSPLPSPPPYATNTLYYQLRNHTFKLGVKGSGSLMLRGKALRIRFLIWMQLGGMTSQKLKW